MRFPKGLFGQISLRKCALILLKCLLTKGEAGSRIVLLLCPDVHDVRLYLHSLVKHWSVPFSNPRRLRQKRGYAVMGIIFGAPSIKILRSPRFALRVWKKRDTFDKTKVQYLKLYT